MMRPFLITGDCHGKFDRFFNEKLPIGNYICLGDFGIDYYLNKTDTRRKYMLQESLSHAFYLVRGNHEQRPSELPGITTLYDTSVQGEVYVDLEFPNIRYLKDGGEYNIEGHSVLVLGGAYSIDKDYRLMQGQQWFPLEQLSEQERLDISASLKPHYDIILSHTAPVSKEPVDLFLSFIDQSSVDKSMEYWLEEIHQTVDYNYWFFGHYHADRWQDEKTRIFYNDIILLSDVAK